MSAKLDNPKTIPKTYSSIINIDKVLSNKKTLIKPPVLLNGELVSVLNKKLTCSICSATILLLNVLLLKMVANYQALVIKLKKNSPLLISSMMIYFQL